MQLAIVHTSFALVDTLGRAVREALPEVGVTHIVDDTALAYVRKHGVNRALMRRMLALFSAAAEGEADVILSACTSVGEAVDAARRIIDVPIVKIDEPMAERAVKEGRRIGILATVESAIEPARRLISDKAAQAGVEVSLTGDVCEGIFELLQSGDPSDAARYDAALTARIMDMASGSDVIVLAQASMARVIPALEAGAPVPVPVLCSPGPAIQRVARLMGIRP